MHEVHTKFHGKPSVVLEVIRKTIYARAHTHSHTHARAYSNAHVCG